MTNIKAEFGKLFLLSVLCTGMVAVGCLGLSAEQSARIDALSAQLLAAKSDYDRVAALAQQARDAVKAGTLDIPGGLALIEKFTEEGKAIAVRAAQIEAESKAVANSGAPWWMVAGSVLMNLATGGAFVKIRGTLGTVLQGFGALSRTYDAVAGPIHATKGAELLKNEILESPKLTTDFMKDLHKKALEGSI